ncbi:MAG TPA: thioredoxin domain-containing protein [Myxococcota bacterium]
MAQDKNSASIVAALIIGLAIVVGALLIRSPIERAVQEIAAVQEALRELEIAGTPPARTPTRTARPDPNRRYSVDTQGSPVRGNPDAKLAIVEFSDFQCPFCNRVAPTLQQIEREYGDQVRIVFKHLPLSMHAKAPAAHAAAEAAHRQGKFWEMHDLIFGDQANMSPERYVEYADRIGLDVERFKRDVESADVKSKIEADGAEAARLGVASTPGFFVNGRYVRGAQPFEVFKALIDEELGRS